MGYSQIEYTLRTFIIILKFNLQGILTYRNWYEFMYLIFCNKIAIIKLCICLVNCDLQIKYLINFVSYSWTPKPFIIIIIFYQKYADKSMIMVFWRIVISVWCPTMFHIYICIEYNSAMCLALDGWYGFWLHDYNIYIRLHDTISCSHGLDCCTAAFIILNGKIWFSKHCSHKT